MTEQDFRATLYRTRRWHNERQSHTGHILAIPLEPAKFSQTPIKVLIMFDTRNPALWVVGFIVIAAIFLFLRRHFGAGARERRRRNRSHAPLVSRKRGPSVTLAVNADESKRDRKR